MAKSYHSVGGLYDVKLSKRDSTGMSSGTSYYILYSYIHYIIYIYIYIHVVSGQNNPFKRVKQSVQPDFSPTPNTPNDGKTGFFPTITSITIASESGGSEFHHAFTGGDTVNNQQKAIPPTLIPRSLESTSSNLSKRCHLITIPSRGHRKLPI